MMAPNKKKDLAMKNRPTTVKIEDNKGFWEDDIDFEDDDKILFADSKRRGTSLILNDVFLMIIHFLQTLAVIQSMALRWPWPENWIVNTRYILLINLDVWDYIKIESNSTYKSVKNFYTPSEEMPIAYWHVMLAWGGFMFLAIVFFIIVYIFLTNKNNPTLLLQLARLQRAYIIGAQLIALPLGTVIARLFWCNSLGRADVSNDLYCFAGTHWAYIAPSIAVVVLFYILYSYWLIQKTKAEMLAMTSDEHEGYLQLKETEYAHGLDILWVVAGFHIFSSFKIHGAHFRAAMHLVHLLLLIFYAVLPSHIFVQAVLINILMLAVVIAFCIVRPFRVSAFNVMLIISYLCLCSNVLVGTMISSFDSFTVQSVWLLPDYTILILIFINSVWLGCLILFCLYITVRSCTCFKWSEPLWPSLTSQGINRLSEHTQKFVRSMLHARILLEKCMSMPAIFAPAHELARQIQIINAYCREAEFLSDPMHDTLWDLLEELIEAHCRIAPKSLFSESVKNSIRHTAAELMKMMPQFTRRVTQREYDFILINPVKRRMLLKMYCMGMFLNGRSENVNREHLVDPAVKEIWSGRGEEFVLQTDDDGYFEDIYPGPLQGPRVRPATPQSVQLRSDDEDEEAIIEAEIWVQDHPDTTQNSTHHGGHHAAHHSMQAFNNPAYQADDISDIMKDNASVDLSVMMEGIPSRPGTAESLLKHQQSRPDTESEFASVTLPPMSRQHTMTTQPDIGGRLSSVISEGDYAMEHTEKQKEY